MASPYRSHILINYLIVYAISYLKHKSILLNLNVYITIYRKIKSNQKPEASIKSKKLSENEGQS